MMVFDTSSISKQNCMMLFILSLRTELIQSTFFVVILDNKWSCFTFSDSPLHYVIPSAQERSENSHISCLLSLTSQKQRWKDCFKAEKIGNSLKNLSLFILKVRESAKARDEIRSGRKKFIYSKWGCQQKSSYLFIIKTGRQKRAQSIQNALGFSQPKNALCMNWHNSTCAALNN